jgi:hypothetical protein
MFNDILSDIDIHPSCTLLVLCNCQLNLNAFNIKWNIIIYRFRYINLNNSIEVKCVVNPCISSSKIEKIRISKESQIRQIENFAGSVWLSLFMDGTIKCKLPSATPSTGLSRIQHLTWTGTILNFETSADVFIWRLSWNFERGSELWSLYITDKTSKDKLSRPHILRVIQQYSSEKYWNHPTSK